MNAENQTPRALSRRSFLKAGCLATAAAALASCVGDEPGSAGGVAPVEKPAIELKSYSFGDETMSKRILVAYASGTGSTIGVAEAIGKTLSEYGFAADVRPVKDDPSPEGYQSMVIGSAVNGGKWLPEAVSYVENHRTALNRLPVAVFCVHIMNTEDDEKSRKNRQAYIDAIRAQVRPVAEAYFTGIGMNPEEDSWLTRWAYRTFKVGGVGDCRDWKKINAWAASLPERLC